MALEESGETCSALSRQTAANMSRGRALFQTPSADHQSHGPMCSSVYALVVDRAPPAGWGSHRASKGAAPRADTPEPPPHTCCWLGVIFGSRKRSRKSLRFYLLVVGNTANPRVKGYRTPR